MSASREPCSVALAPAEISRPPVSLFAVATAVIVTNLFAPQPLVGLIAPSVGLSLRAAGIVSTATLLGYAVGLVLLVPLADLLENRKLVLRMLGGAALAAIGVAASHSALPLLLCLFALGAACSAIQILVPIAASMVDPERRGRVIGDIMGGLMVGILLSRPLASLAASAVHWRAFYIASAGLLFVLTAILSSRLPSRRPALTTNYLRLLGSLWELLKREPILRQRALSASLVMAVFSLFWNAAALRLAQAPFEFDQRGIALFALVGAGGAAVTPIFGRWGDRGWTRPFTLLSHLTILIAMGLVAWAPTFIDAPVVALLLMGLGAVLLDVGVTGDQTLGRREVNLLNPDARARINGLFVSIFFVGGAVGSALTGLAWSFGGWNAICGLGAIFAVAAVCVWAASGRSDTSNAGSS
jgi:predicted MFS family arabinose efflux permease